MNKFIVDDISATCAYGGRILYYNAKVEARIVCYCDPHGEEVRIVTLTASIREKTFIDSVRSVLEKLINGDVLVTYDFKCPRCACWPRLDKIDVYDFSAHREPWRSLLEELFKGKNWEIQKALPGVIKQLSNA